MDQLDQLLFKLTDLKLSSLQTQEYNLEYQNNDISIHFDNGKIQKLTITIKQNDNKNDEWKLVSNTLNKRQHNYLRLLTNRYRYNKFYVFSDDANANPIDFVGVFESFAKAYEVCITYPVAHMFSMETENILFNFKHGKFNKFDPNMQYIFKFSNWYLQYQNDDDEFEIPIDDRTFYIFEEASSWKQWNFLSIEKSLLSTRNYLKKSKLEWSHAYCKEDNTIYDFSIKRGKFIQKISQATEAYLEKFNTFIR
jgi:hypothetical protein